MVNRRVMETLLYNVLYRFSLSLDIAFSMRYIVKWM